MIIDIPVINKGKLFLSSKYLSDLLNEEEIIARSKKKADNVGTETSKKMNNLKYIRPFSLEKIFLIKIIRDFKF